MSYRKEIEQVAYELYEKSGWIEGRDLDNWLEAENIVAGRHGRQETKSRPEKGTAATSEKKGPQGRRQRAVRKPNFSPAPGY